MKDEQVAILEAPWNDGVNEVAWRLEDGERLDIALIQNMNATYEAHCQSNGSVSALCPAGVGPGYVQRIRVITTIVRPQDAATMLLLSPDIDNTVEIGWQNVEQIAEWVAGDGTDPQRLALADGIRAGKYLAEKR